MKTKPPRDIYVAIVRAEKHGKGVHLTADEVFNIAQMDSAIFHSLTVERGPKVVPHE